MEENRDTYSTRRREKRPLKRGHRIPNCRHSWQLILRNFIPTGSNFRDRKNAPSDVNVQSLFRLFLRSYMIFIDLAGYKTSHKSRFIPFLLCLTMHRLILLTNYVAVSNRFKSYSTMNHVILALQNVNPRPIEITRVQKISTCRCNCTNLPPRKENIAAF